MLGGATSVVAVSVCGVALKAEAITTQAAGQAAQAAPAARWTHATGVIRGSDIAVRAGRDKEGRFGVMFKDADGFAPPDELLKSLAAVRLFLSRRRSR